MYNPSDPDSASPGELVEVVRGEAEGVLGCLEHWIGDAHGEDREEFIAQCRKHQHTVRGMMGELHAMRIHLAQGGVSPTEADDFARRCNAALDEIMGIDTASCDPLSMQWHGRR